MAKNYLTVWKSSLRLLRMRVIDDEISCCNCADATAGEEM